MYDVAVVGLGGMGSAAIAHCAKRGARVIGVEQFEREHELGASSGRTRIIRQAYFEDAAYVPLVLRAYELWHELAKETQLEILRLTGLLMAGMPESEVITGSLRAAEMHDLPVGRLDTQQLRARFPRLRVRGGEIGVFERLAGAVFPERAIAAHLAVAVANAAEMRFGTALREWSSEDDAIALLLSDGSRLRARSLILTLGPWFARELRDAGVPLEIQRNVQAWFTPSTAEYDSQTFPAFLIERESLPAPLYGFPDFGDGVKAAFHAHGVITDPDRLDRKIDVPCDVRPVAAALEEWMPGAADRFREAKACMYALTPDRHFVVDRHPREKRVVLCGGFSGHGFKFASVMGEICAQLALDGGTPAPIGFLSLQRFADKKSAVPDRAEKVNENVVS